MKPKMFIASSVERLDLAYAAQENLEHDVEATVWDQGVFQLSRTAMASLIDQLDECDFGLFVLSPDDITQIRDAAKLTVRDNVIFELGLFIGRLGTDRCFMVVPRGLEELHLPTDLLGLAPALFEANRQDGNLNAALGAACNRIRKAVQRHGVAQRQELEEDVSESKCIELVSDPNDCISLIESWMGSRPAKENLHAIKYSDVDRELKLVAGSARNHIATAARRWGYVNKREGQDFVMFEEAPVSSGRLTYF